jgi:hypothetical protein
LILFGVISIVVSACSSEVPEPTATVVPTATTAAATTRDVVAYLNSIENNAVQVTAAFARVDEHMSKVWPTKGSLLDAFSDSNLAQEIIASMGAVVQLLPPDEFEQEHKILQSAATEVVEYSRQLEQALQGRDLLGVMVAKANFAVSYKRMLMTVSPRLCKALGIDDDPETLCEVRAGAPGTYDADVERLFKVFRVEFIPRVTSFALALSEEERFSVLAALNREVEVATRNAVEELAALSPSQGRADDHQILLTYLEETGKTASAITVAGEEQDGETLQLLFDQSGTILESTAALISCDYSDTLLHGFFRTCAP